MVATIIENPSTYIRVNNSKKDKSCDSICSISIDESEANTRSYYVKKKDFQRNYPCIPTTVSLGDLAETFNTKGLYEVYTACQTWMITPNNYTELQM